MEINTKNFGLIPYREEETVHFPKGLPGLPDLKNFLVLAYEEMQPLKFLQSVDNPLFSFVLVNPLLLDPHYACEITVDDYADIDLRPDESALLYIIVTVPNEPSQISGNFKAPIVINARNMRAKQIVLEEKRYSVKVCVPEILDRRALSVETKS